MPAGFARRPRLEDHMLLMREAQALNGTVATP